MEAWWWLGRWRRTAGCWQLELLGELSGQRWFQQLMGNGMGSLPAAGSLRWKPTSSKDRGTFLSEALSGCSSLVLDALML